MNHLSPSHPLPPSFSLSFHPSYKTTHLPALPRRNRHSNRGPGRTGSSLLTLIVVFNDFANVGFGLGFVGGGFDVVEGVRGLDEDGVVDYDLGIGPAGWEAVKSRVSFEFI